MPTKTVSINFYLRDANGDVVGNPNATGTTDDDGVTIIVPIGYLTGIENAPPEDIFIVVNQPSVQVPVASISVTPDEVNGIQTISVTAA